MSKIHSKYVCQECRHASVKWIGKCPSCFSWNSFEEEELRSSLQKEKTPKSVTAKKISQIHGIHHDRLHTKIDEFDRVMGGGITKGSLTLVGGEPGVGKSTLIMEISKQLSSLYKECKILYISGEESELQVATRCKRLGVSNENIYILHETCWQNILDTIKQIEPKFLILDSIQTTISNEIGASAGSVSQVKEVTFELMNFAKANELTCFVIGHVTKDGGLAGPKILEHMVDTVVHLDGDPTGHYRILRSIKNRFGNTNEVGIFEMKEEGLIQVNKPSEYFLDQSSQHSYGRSITCLLEGSRPLFAEVQSLVIENRMGSGRQTTQGLDKTRLAMLTAIVDKYFDIPLSLNDVYINIIGMMKFTTKEADLSTIASLLSSVEKKPITKKTIFIGEVGLTGEVRSVPQIESRLKEIELLNYDRVITSAGVAKKYAKKFKTHIIGIEQAIELKQHIFC